MNNGWFQPRTAIDWIIFGLIIGNAAWWSHVLRSDIPVIKIIGG